MALSASLTLTWCHHERHHSFLEGIVEISMLIVLYVPGKALGPTLSGHKRHVNSVPFLKVLLDMRHFRLFGAWWRI
jgi:hypothetical protein